MQIIVELEHDALHIDFYNYLTFFPTLSWAVSHHIEETSNHNHNNGHSNTSMLAKEDEQTRISIGK